MNKSILKSNYDKIFVSSYREKKLHKMSTSGSTGVPFSVEQNMEKRWRHIADLKYFGELAGYKDGTPMCYLRSKPSATLEEQKRSNIYQLNTEKMDDESLIAYHIFCIEHNCVAFMAYASNYDTMLNCWEKYFPENGTQIKSVISTSENLSETTRQRLQKYFGSDCGIYARYSNMENGIMGQETEHGKYLLNWASYHFEILKMDSDEPAAEGELGRIVVTDLYNYAFPMIRYDTGDVAKMYYPEYGFPYLTDLYGRRVDLIYDSDGNVICPNAISRTIAHFFDVSLKASQIVKQWQFIQTGETEYCLKLQSEDKSISSEFAGIISEFQALLGERAKIKVEIVGGIPVLASGKRKFVVNKWKNG